ncbi:WAP-type 'four-disulfide core' domain [Trinorchestia longiramus]|nr:WAP-type 'four-disulfide core' domain [Trinorchestia longiramus]
MKALLLLGFFISTTLTDRIIFPGSHVGNSPENTNSQMPRTFPSGQDTGSFPDRGNGGSSVDGISLIDRIVAPVKTSPGFIHPGVLDASGNNRIIGLTFPDRADLNLNSQPLFSESSYSGSALDQDIYPTILESGSHPVYPTSSEKGLTERNKDTNSFPHSHGCRFQCKSPTGQVYCCEKTNQIPSLVHTKREHCPPARSSCPNTRASSVPSSCSNDNSCSGVDKCCFDVCLQYNTCKAVQDDGR